MMTDRPAWDELDAPMREQISTSMELCLLIGGVVGFVVGVVTGVVFW